MGVSALLEQLYRRIYANEGPSGLKPAQWAALRFFANAGQETRTVSGLTQFMGITVGPASRTVKALVGRGLLAPKEHPSDKRSTVFEITDKARQILERDPILDLAHCVAKLGEDDLDQLAIRLVEIGEALESHRASSGR